VYHHLQLCGGFWHRVTSRYYPINWKEGRKEGRKGGREGGRKEGRKEERKEGRKEDLYSFP